MSERDTRQPAATSGLVQSVTRAFALLETLAEADQELPLAEVALRTGLAQPTAHRLLRTMQAKGYVKQSSSRNYHLGSGLIGLGEKATPPLASRAIPYLKDLEELSQETANLAVLDGEMIAYIAQIASRHQMRMFTEVGRRVPAHAAGAGKAILSTLPEPRVREIAKSIGLDRFTNTTLTTVEALISDLRETRRRGFALDDGEREVGVRCIAVPIPDSSPRAALSISGPAARVTDQRAPAIIEALKLAARDLTDHCSPSQISEVRN